MITITKENYEEIVVNSDKPVLIDFWAPWCGPCQTLGPILEGVDRDMEGLAVIGKVNVDEQPELANKHGIRNIPTMIVLQNGLLVDRKIGIASKQNIKKMILPYTTEEV